MQKFNYLIIGCLLILNVNIILGKVAVTNIATFMVNSTTEEGYAGPGFFISNEAFSEVSDSMKKKLGIQDHKKRASTAHTSTHHTITNNNLRNNSRQGVSFAQKASEIANNKSLTTRKVSKKNTVATSFNTVSKDFY